MSAPFMLCGSAFAGEIGVTNSYGHSWRTGTGQTNVQWVTNSQLDEQSVSIAGKIETTTSETLTGAGGLSNDWEDGDDKDKGKGNDKGSGGALGGTYAGSESLSFAGTIGTRNYTETTNVDGESTESYSFGSSNFTHSVSTFSR
ncbi:MAG: hypothetical protein ACO295_08295 [Sediminibacterium sp.]